MLLAILLLLGSSIPRAATWEAVRGEWDMAAGTGRAVSGEWADLLSAEWYGDFDFSGQVTVSTAAQSAVLARYAGESENYALVLDWPRSRVLLQENHFGVSRELTAGKLPAKGRTARFRLISKENSLSATVWLPGATAVTLHFGHVQVPEGRAGLAVQHGQLLYKDLQLSGETKSRFETYAFHCNYKLPDRLGGQPLWQYLDSAASALRKRFPQNFASLAAYEQYRQRALLELRRSLGLDPWPERTPLNARVVGTVDRGNFRIEKVIFESQPGFLVDALLYVPKKAKLPAPAILSPIGHYSENGFFIWSEQGRAIGLARKGYVVLTYDPIGQGERKWLGAGNHDTLRRKLILSGMEVSGLMFWDSIRAIDYLVSRPEVDASRIGVTGVSGGGFNTLYTAALDERVKAAAPAGFATTLEALIRRANAGCCAYVPNLARYAEFEDIYSLIVPRRLLILGAYMDVLSDRLLPIYEAARKIYALYGAEDGLSYFMDRDAGHTYSKPMRLAMYRFFNRWLKGTDDPAQALEPRDPEDNLISRESGLLKVFGPGDRGVDAVELESTYLARNRVPVQWPSTADNARAFQQEVVRSLNELLGNDGQRETNFDIASDDHAASPGAIRHVTLKVERFLPIPIQIHQPAVPRANRMIVYFTMKDRYPTADTTAEQMVRKLVAMGFDVAVPQVRGAGSTRVSDMNSVMLYSMALGKHLFAGRIGDLRAVIGFLKVQPEYRGDNLALWGEGPSEGPMVLYLAAVDPRIETVVSSHGLVSYQNIVDEDGLPDFDYYIPGMLKYVDVPEILGAIAPRRAIISAPVTIHNTMAGDAETRYGSARNLYELLGASRRFSLVSQVDLLRVLRGE